MKDVQLHGFCCTLKVAYPGVMYMYVRAIDDQGGIHMSLVVAITKVAPWA